MIRLALALHITSPAAYELVRDTGMIKLPSSRTLFDYSHAKPIEDEIDKVVLQSVADRVSKLEKPRRFHVLMADEMSICQNLVFRKVTGKVIGYTKLDDVDKEIQLLEQYLDNPEEEAKEILASKFLVFMIKGVSSGIKEVIATYAVANPSVNQMYSWTWKVIRALETSKVPIIAFVCDGFSSNRAFIRRHTPVTKLSSGVVFDTVNRAARDRVLYFISDVPHLLKTIRNCMLNSRNWKDKSKRSMTRNGKKIHWDFIIKLYELNKNKNFRKSFKLNAMNVYPDSYARMKVKYAAEVISNTVAQDLEDKKWDGASELIKFIREVNRWFDCLNGAHTTVSHKRNPDLRAYTKEILEENSTDDRFQFLNKFLDDLKKWKEDAYNPNMSLNTTTALDGTNVCSGEDESEVFEGGDEDVTPASRRLLSRETLEGIEMSTRGIMGAIKFLLKEGLDFINPRVFTQDPLEQHFSRVRSGQGGSNNTNFQQTLNRNRNLHVIGQLGMKKRKGNAGESHSWVEVTSEPLAKRKCNNVLNFIRL